MAFSSSPSSFHGPELVLSDMFFFGSLAFKPDDSAWLSDSRLQAQLLPSRGSVHFRADESGALRLQPLAHHQAHAFLSVCHKKKRSGRPRVPYRSRHLLLQQVAVTDSMESAQQALGELIAREGPTASILHLFSSGEEDDLQMSDFELEMEQEGSSNSPITVAEVCMTGTPPSRRPQLERVQIKIMMQLGITRKDNLEVEIVF